MTLKVSVVMAVYNGREFLGEQLDSVLSQLELGDELIVIDDASTDGSTALLKAFDPPVIKLFCNARNVGAVRTFDRALGIARNQIVFLCDQDDIWLPGKRAAFEAEFAHDPRVFVVISDAEVIDRDGKVVARSFMATLPGGFDGRWLSTLRTNRYLGCAMAVRRPLLEVALPIPLHVPMHDMWLGALADMLGRVIYLPTPYIQYRRHGRNATAARSANWHRMLFWRLNFVLALLRRILAIVLGLHKRSRPGKNEEA